ncbi:hypothetical protein ONZ43_g354 [Nemania bipapillata]|uniref:Uncharacterized protein n=1 Tax=Nemania bipapillata TaxID=110536 RepID=A0ACC2J9C0_9PEZI|nr:hypothetical protein ONZ43_g354 [Nemania bipapillata]
MELAPLSAGVTFDEVSADDVIVFLNGEKTNPVSMEQPWRDQRRYSRGAQSVDEANRTAPAHARINKSLILVAAKPLIRAGKGTTQRAASILQHTAGVQVVEAIDVDGIIRFIRNTLSDMEGLSEINDDTNFFDCGMDSLQALHLVRTMRKALGYPSLALSTIYQNPAARQLAATSSSWQPIEASYRDLVQEISKPADTLDAGESPVDILLTGSTGTLGTSILHALLGCPNFERFTACNLGTDILNDRVAFLRADLTDPKLGLGEETYTALRARVGISTHNALSVNFNLSLLSFRPLLVGLVNLFKFAAGAPRVVRTFFISSISSVSGIGSPAPTETVLDESKSLSTSLANGSARSKRLAELLCDAAARHLGISVVLVHVGQVGGSTTQRGAIWNMSEWLPSLVICSLLRLKRLPDSLGPYDGAEVFNLRNPNTVSWSSLIPIIGEADKTKVDGIIQVVPYAAWMAQLQESGDIDSNEEDTKVTRSLMVKNPAVKLINFYREGLWPQLPKNIPTQSPILVTRIMVVSNTLRNMPPVSPEWMIKWVIEWLEVADSTNT